MNTSDVIAIIGVVGTLTAPILALTVNKYILERNYNRINKSRKKALQGRWKGNFRQDVLSQKKQVQGTITGNLKVKGRLVQGTMRLENKVHKTNPSFTLKGGLKNDRFLVLNYENEKMK